MCERSKNWGCWARVTPARLPWYAKVNSAAPLAAALVLFANNVTTGTTAIIGNCHPNHKQHSYVFVLSLAEREGRAQAFAAKVAHASYFPMTQTSLMMTTQDVVLQNFLDVMFAAYHDDDAHDDVSRVDGDASGCCFDYIDDGKNASELESGGIRWETSSNKYKKPQYRMLSSK